MEFSNEPISRIQWIDVRTLTANEYNPNIVLSQEMKLLAFSILKNGWIQPILASLTNVVIDGFHRHWLAANNKELIERYNYMVPVVPMDITEPERMLLTIRINRAKGQHQAYKMHEVVARLFE